MGQSKPIGTPLLTGKQSAGDVDICDILNEIDQLIADGQKLRPKSIPEIKQRIFLAQEEEP